MQRIVSTSRFLFSMVFLRDTDSSPLWAKHGVAWMHLKIFEIFYTPRVLSVQYRVVWLRYIQSFSTVKFFIYDYRDL